MIVYDLGCENNHRFEGWFASSEDFEGQMKGRLLSCPFCGNNQIVRLPHAAYVNTGVREAPGKAPGAPQHYANFGAEFVSKLIDHIIATTEDVGSAFPEEARKIHYGEAPERRIRGTASHKEFEALTDEGIEVAALPIPAHLAGKTH